MDDLLRNDEPWKKGLPDVLRRRPFARRIAEVIRAHSDDAGFVIGVFGPWGDGKTSVLRMVHEELESSPKVVVHWFNPWYFESPEQLIIAYFSDLADRLEVSIGTASDELNRVLNKYGKLLSAVPTGLLGAPNPGAVLAAVGTWFRQSSLSDLRRRIESELKRQGLRIVIMVDDIDRLDRSEVLAVLKLVKLTGSFPNHTFVLAFDDVMLARVIAEEYGDGDPSGGKSFLEKIVQLPLRLPGADESVLLSLALEQVDHVLRTTETPLLKAEAHEFRRYFDPLFQARPRTARAGKRLGNALGFLFPLLPGEIHVGDLLLLESLRLFYPAVHDAVTLNKDLFIGRLGRSSVDDAQKTAYRSRLDEILRGLSPEEREAIEDLLEHLFPPMQVSVGKISSFGSGFQDQWAKGKRAASRDYFDRYFQYAVPPEDIPDELIAAILDHLSEGRVAEAVTAIKEAADNRSPERVVTKLRRAEEDLSEKQAISLTKAIASLGESFPTREGFMASISAPHTQAAILAAQALKQVSAPSRLDAAQELLSTTKPISFALECLRWLQASDEDRKTGDSALFNPDEEASLAQTVLPRLHESASADDFLNRDGRTIQLVLSWMKRLDAADSLESILRDHLIKDPCGAPKLLLAFVSQAWSMETGLPLPGDLSREAYDFITSLVPAALVLSALESCVGQRVEPINTEYAPKDTDPTIRVARRFAFLHDHAMSTSLDQPREKADPLPSEEK